MGRETYYLPILKSHEAEGRALSELAASVRGITAPLIQVSHLHASRLARLLPHTIGRRLAKYVVGNCGAGEVALELGPLLDRSDGADICREVAHNLQALRSDARLVIRLSEDELLARLTPARDLFTRNGAVLRVTREEFVSTSLSGFPTTLRRFGLDPTTVDLVIDCQLVSEGEAMVGTLGRLERDYRWRTLTYVGGSFPMDLSELDANNQYELIRHEWTIFSSERRRRTHRVRYGDYAIQHPLQRDPLPPVLPSGSIRYTSDTYWVVMRGEKLDKKGGPGFQQYIGQAQLLRERPEFRGATFSSGDAYIDWVASQSADTGKRTHPGSPTKWIQAGVNHHITLAAQQAAGLLAA